MRAALIVLGGDHLNNHEYVSMHLDLMGRFSVFNEALARVCRGGGVEEGGQREGDERYRSQGFCTCIFFHCPALFSLQSCPYRGKTFKICSGCLSEQRLNGLLFFFLNLLSLNRAEWRGGA